jgi:hypothetical protein
MSRQKLLDIAARFTAWFSNPDSDAASLATLVSKDVVLHVPTPGGTADFAGLLARHQTTVAATKDLKTEVKTQSVDETTGTVTQFFEISGTQTGYASTFPFLHFPLRETNHNRAGSGMGFRRPGNLSRYLVWG